mmetsp:Transcript_4944/g.31650  ORF Transcript_4944/g.31650 Transcript_4944/m.31650 type:complete len:249 (-) Transcript_4944:2854-3600(-)
MMVYTSKGKNSSAPGGDWSLEEEANTLLITRQQFITQISLSPGALYWFTFCSSFCASTHEDSSQCRGGISKFEGLTKSNAPIFADSKASRSLSSALTPKQRSYSLIITYFSRPSMAASTSSGFPSRHSGCLRTLASICCKNCCTFWLPRSTGGWLRLYHCKKLRPCRTDPNAASAHRPCRSSLCHPNRLGCIHRSNDPIFHLRHLPPHESQPLEPGKGRRRRSNRPNPFGCTTSNPSSSLRFTSTTWT